MDWLDEKIENITKRVRNLTLRKALFVYIFLCIIVVVVLYALTASVCEKWDNLIWSKYSATDELINSSSVVYYQDMSILTRDDAIFVQVIDFIQTWSIFIYSISGILGVVFTFYNKKLKEPLRILNNATKEVGNSNLDVDISYNSKDEMGDLCQSFELMKNQLIMNNQKMWDMMEEQKRLNAAFAHDLRTPLTVLRGYTDFLKQYVPEGKVTEEKLITTLTMMSNHIERLERYSNTMKEIYSIEEIPIHPMPVDWKTLKQKVEDMIEVLNGRNGISIQLTGTQNDCPNQMYLDEAILMEVLDNLLSNALRYAKGQVSVMLTSLEEEKQVLLTVLDDGKGFSSKDLSMATKPYYTDNSGSNHFGIGLYICKLLCEKHGGGLSISNGMNKGAVVTAAFGLAK